MPTIMVVDDESTVCELIKVFLTKQGYSVQTAHSGEEALQKLQDEEPSLMVLDVRMTGIDGIEVLRRIRKSGSNLPVIIMTALPEEKLFQEALSLGANKCIKKPFDLKYLEDSICSAIKPSDS